MRAPFRDSFLSDAEHIRTMVRAAPRAVAQKACHAKSAQLRTMNNGDDREAGRVTGRQFRVKQPSPSAILLDGAAPRIVMRAAALTAGGTPPDADAHPTRGTAPDAPPTDPFVTGSLKEKSHGGRARRFGGTSTWPVGSPPLVRSSAARMRKRRSVTLVAVT